MVLQLTIQCACSHQQTTTFDHEMVKYLEEVSGTKAIDLYQEMLNASDSVTNKTDVEFAL